MKKDEKVILHDYQTAYENSLPIILVDNIEDLADALSELEGMGVKTQDFVINSHGSPGAFSVGFEPVDIHADFTPLRKGLQNKNVLIGACDVGLNKEGAAFTLAFSDDTKSKTITSLQPIVSGYKYDGSNYITNGIRIIPTKYSTFNISLKGPCAKRVFNLTIDKKWGIKYNNWNRYEKSYYKRD